MLVTFPCAASLAGIAVEPVPVPPGYPQAAGLRLTANGVAVPVLRVILNRRHREVFNVASFAFDASARIELTIEKGIGSVSILPSGYGIQPVISGHTIRFTLTRPRHLFIQLPGCEPLLLFADGPEGFPEPTAGLNTFDVVARYGADPSGKTESTVAIQRAIDDATVRGGTVLLPKGGVFRSGKLILKDNVRLHIAGGASLRFVDVIASGFDYTKDFPGLYFLSTTANSSNIAVTGRGLLDCNGEALRGTDHKRKLISAFHASRVTGLTLEGITIIDSSSWTVVPAFSRRVLIRNLKIVNTLCLYEDDGIDPVGCQDVLVDHCFVVATDDAFCPKPGGVGTHGGGAKPGPAMGMRDVVFNDCVAWTHAAGFKLGRQSSVPALNIVAKNSHVLNCSRGCVIDHDGGGAPFRNILFQDITIEGVCKYAPVHIETRDPGPTSEVTYERLAINSPEKPLVRLRGKDDVNRVSGIRFIDCAVRGQPVVSGKANPLRIADDKFVKDIRVIRRDPAQREPGYTLTAVWGTNPEEALAGAPVPAKPAVLVTDRENRPVSGVEVVFSVESGGGAVTQPTTISDARGIATVGGWMLGPAPGVNTLVAGSSAATGSHVVFMTKGTNRP